MAPFYDGARWRGNLGVVTMNGAGRALRAFPALPKQGPPFTQARRSLQPHYLAPKGVK